jgi:HAD superfamily hydrolase (TIGR01509 family)
VSGFPAVRQLFERVRANGQRIALASSAKADELSSYKEIVGIADLSRTSADHAERSKPHPDIFAAAFSRLGGMDPSQAIVVGDSRPGRGQNRSAHDRRPVRRVPGTPGGLHSDLPRSR